MMEEYDIKSHELLVRKWKKVKDYKESDWEYEIGEAPPKNKTEELLSESTSNPVFLRKDDFKSFQFRIRNLPYPEDVYSVTVDEEKQEIVVRTSNKKYFKRISIPDMKRNGLKLEESALSWAYKNNTLIVSYAKPSSILKSEEKLIEEFKKLNLKQPKEGDVECTQQ
eukprot:CAMPEP_0176447358 /NCGR_PEP_ID=MMETSP0127-20121128/24973_1 /TAXON_ID=938130 /ORGANISM="Platyophrya macrostoma, Strain WH" /LENGTH=166 /DNA_ID=CAMNT_0017833767 /DNA_START=105 /DNA_END=605 /DNA_ORIENTATION=+